MNPILRIAIGLLITGFGVLVVWKTPWIMGFFGRSAWAEQKLGGGGSHLLYKFVGIVFCVIGIIVATNLWNAFLQATLGSVLIR